MFHKPQIRGWLIVAYNSTYTDEWERNFFWTSHVASPCKKKLHANLVIFNQFGTSDYTYRTTPKTDIPVITSIDRARSTISRFDICPDISWETNKTETGGNGVTGGWKRFLPWKSTKKKTVRAEFEVNRSGGLPRFYGEDSWGRVTDRGGVGHGARIFNAINASFLCPSLRGGQCRTRIMHALFGVASCRHAGTTRAGSLPKGLEISRYDLSRPIGYLAVLPNLGEGVKVRQTELCFAARVPLFFQPFHRLYHVTQ